MQKVNLKRLRVLYYIFFALIVFSVGFVLLSIVSFDKYEKSVRAKLKESVIEKDNTFFVFQNLINKNKTHEFDIPIHTDTDKNVSISGRINTYDILIQGQNFGLDKSKYLTTSMTFAIATIIFSFFIVIALGLLFWSFRKSFKKGLIFSKRDIMYIRIIAILLICISLFSNLSAFFEQLEVANLLSNTDWVPVIIFQIPFMQIIFGVVILFISEFFSVGYQLQEEQELTI